MSSEFERLHPDVRRLIVNNLGWSAGLRPVQEMTIGPILEGDNAVVLAPTAGGKTEAAFFPLMTRVIEEVWEPLAIIYVSPLKALLNNQYERLENLFRLIGHEVGVWHGDIAQTDKKRMRDQPPTVLLTTPESLEGMLISRTTSAQKMFRNLRAVVIDEVHAFADDDRGWHLLGVLNRLAQWSGRDIQRIGLSATVGNKDEIVDWLSRGSQHARTTVDPPRPTATEPDVTLDWVANLSNAAHVISQLHRGERRLVFCDSRILSEKLTRLLRDRGVRTHLIHGSLSAAERRQTERTFSEGQPGVIVSTSALELGIDIGDLDRVIQIDAPFSVASFLQRMGRTGRRPGTTPNMLMLATERQGLARGAAILELWKRGYVEPAIPPAHPYHILAQQMLARSLECPGEVVPSFRDAALRFALLAGESEDVVTEVFRSLMEHDFLFTDGVRMGMGTEGEADFGYRHFMELVTVFTTPPIFKVFHTTREIGDVHQSTFFDKKDKDDSPLVILLAGRTWFVKDIDWKRRRAYVEPLKMTGKSRWVGTGHPMSRALAEAHRQVFLGSELGAPHWSKRAGDELTGIRMEHGFVEPHGTIVLREDGKMRLWTFAGDYANRYLAAMLDQLTGEKTSSDGLAVTVKTDKMLGQMETALDLDAIRRIGPMIDPDHPLLEQLKFNSLLPPDLLQRAAEARFFGNGREELATIGPFHFLDLSAATGIE